MYFIHLNSFLASTFACIRKKFAIIFGKIPTSRDFFKYPHNCCQLMKNLIILELNCPFFKILQAVI